MILGWHRSAIQFLKKHQRALAQVPVAYFFTALSLTQTNETHLDATPIWVDAALAKPPHNPKRLSLREGYATVTNYLRPALKAAPSIKPVSAGFFGGKLEMFRLKFLQMLFVMVVIQARPGDFRNWSAIQEWAASLAPVLLR